MHYRSSMHYSMHHSSSSSSRHKWPACTAAACITAAACTTLLNRNQGPLKDMYMSGTKPPLLQLLCSSTGVVLCVLLTLFGSAYLQPIPARPINHRDSACATLASPQICFAASLSLLLLLLCNS